MLAGLLPDRQKRLLQNLLGQIPPAEHLDGDSEQTAGGRLIDLSERVPVACCGCFQQLRKMILIATIVGERPLRRVKSWYSTLPWSTDQFTSAM